MLAVRSVQLAGGRCELYCRVVPLARKTKVWSEIEVDRRAPTSPCDEVKGITDHKKHALRFSVDASTAAHSPACLAKYKLPSVHVTVFAA